MAIVTELGYLGISVSDAAAWKSYATEVMGMQLVDEGERDRFYLRMDLWHHRIVVHTGGDDDLAYVGWRVAGAQELEEMSAKLTASGVEVRRGSEAEAAERRVLGLFARPGGQCARNLFLSFDRWAQTLPSRASDVWRFQDRGPGGGPHHPARR
ncbi:VOC family protein [Massilia sp. WF1]|uniref:VOC family protein n=1 Tax=Massilia sp. WF1 TaxID=1406431 RepID=UPI0027D92B39|nr:VOC family protein [Massilia sp. WF1]